MIKPKVNEFRTCLTRFLGIYISYRLLFLLGGQILSITMLSSLAPSSNEKQHYCYSAEYNITPILIYEQRNDLHRSTGHIYCWSLKNPKLSNSTIRHFRKITWPPLLYWLSRSCVCWKLEWLTLQMRWLPWL